MDAAQLMQLLFIAANAKTVEEKTRVAWRASDYMWWMVPAYGIVFCRAFNDLCGDQNWPRVKNLWSEEEKEEYLAGYKDLRIPQERE